MVYYLCRLFSFRDLQAGFPLVVSRRRWLWLLAVVVLCLVCLVNRCILYAVQLVTVRGVTVYPFHLLPPWVLVTPGAVCICPYGLEWHLIGSNALESLYIKRGRCLLVPAAKPVTSFLLICHVLTSLEDSQCSYGRFSAKLLVNIGLFRL